MYFLDTSAVLTLFLRQPSWEAVLEVIERCAREGGFLAAAFVTLDREQGQVAGKLGFAVPLS